MEKKDIHEKLNDLIGELTDQEFKDYCLSWYDEQNFLDIINEWDEDVKKDAVKEIKAIIKKRK
jgi:hypothetical protein